VVTYSKRLTDSQLFSLPQATKTKKFDKKELQTCQFDRPISNGMAALSREDTTPQSLAGAYCSSAVQ